MRSFIPSPPQLRMREHLDQHPLALEFIGMGIGKTAGSLDSLCKLLKNKRFRGALVVAPMRVINLTWPGETRAFTEFQGLKIANLRNDIGRRAFIKGAAHLYLINYESLPKLTDMVKHRGGTVPWDLEIWDELTRARNPSSKRIQQFRRTVPRAKRRWGLTGTPAPNSLLDLFAQVRLIDDGERLGKSYDHYKQTYFTQKGYGGYKWEPRPGAKEEIYARIADITLTLKSSEWLDIPDTVVEDIEVTLPTEILKKYQAFERELVYQIKHDQEITATNAAALVSKLLQFTSGSMYDENKVHHHVHDLKIEALRKIVKHTKSPVLVAYAFKHEEERLRKAFPEARFFSDAKTQIAQSLLLDKWNKGQIPILVAHPKSVGHGLNLQHGGNTLVWMTLTYSREDYEQMIARLARRGQDAITQVYRLMCPGTVDDAVAVAIEEKQKTENHLLSALMMLESYRKNGAPVVIAEPEPEEVDWI